MKKNETLIKVVIVCKWLQDKFRLTIKGIKTTELTLFYRYKAEEFRIKAGTH